MGWIRDAWRAGVNEARARRAIAEQLTPAEPPEMGAVLSGLVRATADAVLKNPAQTARIDQIRMQIRSQFADFDIDLTDPVNLHAAIAGVATLSVVLFQQIEADGRPYTHDEVAAVGSVMLTALAPE